MKLVMIHAPPPSNLVSRHNTLCNDNLITPVYFFHVRPPALFRPLAKGSLYLLPTVGRARQPSHFSLVPVFRCCRDCYLRTRDGCHRLFHSPGPTFRTPPSSRLNMPAPPLTTHAAGVDLCSKQCLFDWSSVKLQLKKCNKYTDDGWK